MSNGRLVPLDGERDSFTGYVATLSLQQRFTMKPNPRYKSGDRDVPAYLLFAKIGTADVQIGSAWSRTMVNGDQAGERMLSLTLDDPSFAQPLYLSAFPTREGGAGFDIVWRRKRERPDASTFRPDMADEEMPR